MTRNNGVDLRRAIWCAQRGLVQATVGLLILLPVGEQPHQEFANMTLGPRGLEQTDQQEQRDKPTQRAPNLRDDGSEVHFSASINSSNLPDLTESECR